MQVNIDISTDLESLLREEWGDLSAAAKEALAIESYRRGKISLGLLAEMLGMRVIEADEWLARRGVSLTMSAEDLEADRADLRAVYPDFRS